MRLYRRKFNVNKIRNPTYLMPIYISITLENTHTFTHSPTYFIQAKQKISTTGFLLCMKNDDLKIVLAIKCYQTAKKREGERNYT